MKATTFDTDAPLDERRIIVRYGDEGVEMVELPWGLCPKEPGNPPFMLVRAESFPAIAVSSLRRNSSSAAMASAIGFHSRTVTGSISPGSGGPLQRAGPRPMRS